MSLIDRTSLGSQLADRLRSKIISGELEPGTHLVEDVLAEEYGVSRGPVRDALKTLSGEWLVESRRRGFFVRPISEDDIAELYSLREAIELLAGRAAMERKPDEGAWAGAESALTGMYDAAGVGDWHRFADQDLRFHTAIYELSGHRRLLALWAQYRPTFGALLDMTNRQDPDLRPSADDHRELLDNLRAGAGDTFAESLRSHLEGSRRRMLDALRPHWRD